MKFFTLTLISILAVISVDNLEAVTVRPQVDYDATGDYYFVDNSGAVLSGTDEFLFFGTFDTLPTSASTAQQIENDFNQLGGSPLIYATGFSFVGDVDPSLFQSQQGYLVAANNADIGLATEVAIVSNSTIAGWSFAADLTGTPATQAAALDDVAATNGEVVLGSFGTGNTIKLALVVPEPSSLALLGLGLVGFTLRRRR